MSVAGRQGELLCILHIHKSPCVSICQHIWSVVKEKGNFFLQKMHADTHTTPVNFSEACVCVSGNPLYSFSQIGWGKWNFLESEKEKRENKIQD